MGCKLGLVSFMTGMSNSALDILLRQKDGGGEEEGIIRKVQMGKKQIKQSEPAVFSMCMLCIFMRVARFCVLYAFCCFLPVQVASHGEPH